MKSVWQGKQTIHFRTRIRPSTPETSLSASLAVRGNSCHSPLSSDRAAQELLHLRGLSPVVAPSCQGGIHSPERGSPEETEPVPTAASCLATFQAWLDRETVDCPALPRPHPASVFLMSAGVIQRAREAHTHPELLLVRDSLSVCPRPSLLRVSVL